MTMICKICTHPNKLEIDRAIVKGGALAAIVKNFGVPYNSLYNHARNHLSRQLGQAYNKLQLQEDFNLLQRVDQILTRAEDIFKRNYRKGKDTVALKALDSQKGTIELLAKISYSFHQAKLAEIELARIESGEQDQDLIQSQIAENIAVLTPKERAVLKQLVLKMASQDEKMVVLPQPTPQPENPSSSRRRQRSKHIGTEAGVGSDPDLPKSLKKDVKTDVAPEPLPEDEHGGRSTRGREIPGFEAKSQLSRRMAARSEWVNRQANRRYRK